LRDAQAELEACQRKVKVALEHRDMVSQQLEHAVVYRRCYLRTIIRI